MGVSHFGQESAQRERGRDVGSKEKTQARIYLQSFLGIDIKDKTKVGVFLFDKHRQVLFNDRICCYRFLAYEGFVRECVQQPKQIGRAHV